MQKKNDKLSLVVFSTILLFAFSNNEAKAVSSTDDTYGKNGVAYILLSSEFDSPGIYRMNEYDGSVAENPWRIFKTNTITGKVSGLAANQKKQVFLLSALEGDNFYDAPVGWLPTGIKFNENSNIYLKAAAPNDGGMNEYVRSGMPHRPYTHSSYTRYYYWYKDLKINDTTYKYVVHFGGPVGVKFLNGKDGIQGTPIWDGTFVPDSSNAAAIKHPTDPQKIILPSHFGALSYYLYGTKNEPAIQGLPMDGTDGRDLYTFTQTNGAGYFGGDSKHRAATMFACIVKRIYSKRTNSLDLYAATDPTVSNGNYPKDKTMNKTQSGVLATTDVKVRESYGKLCGDNCIDGGEIAGNKPIETALSTVTVVTSTNGNRYGFNPVGTYKGSNSTDASLRVVDTNNNTKVIDISTDDAGNSFSSKITNGPLLASKGVTPASMRTIGVSTNYTTDDGEDFIYGSQADHFVVQDSWWGLGGIAYEYYKGDDDDSGKIVKTDYMANENPTPEVVSTSFSGKIDSIGIDGDGYLYALKTEESPSDEEMKKIQATVGADNIDSSSYKTNPNQPNSLPISYSGWKRDITSTTSSSEIINESTIDVPEGSQRAGDYKIATVYQKVYKSVKRYPQGTGSLGTEEPRGSLEVGYDAWTNNLKLKSDGSLTWDFDIWRQCSEAERASCMPAELAVVNVAASPISIEGSAKKYICVTKIENETDSPTYTPGQVINEQDTLTFKVEGYLPVIDGKQTAFKHVGKIGNRFNDVYLNSIPAKDGKYEHDEDNDGNKSGFPSSMFEGSDDYKTLVTWEIAQVEDTTPVPLKNAKLITPIEEINISETTFKSLKYKFKQPGRYILQATVKFNYFSNFETAKNPTDLEASTGTFTTEPYMVCVVAKELNLNNSVSYINNISIKMLDNNVPVAHKNFDNTQEQSLSIVDATFNEDNSFNNDGKSIQITFDAQFAWIENDNTTGNLITHSGVGVWEYEYYKNIYARELSGCEGVTPPTGLPSTLAYNHIGGYADPSTVYSSTIYNPGKRKASDPNSEYDAGTTINEDPNKHDKKFIQWALYLVPVSATKIDPLQPAGFRTRGVCIANGDCSNTQTTQIKRKNSGSYDGLYSVTINVPKIEKLFKTPRDPQYYTLALEIVYPRVSWLNNDLGYGDGNKYYSSLIPYGNSSSSDASKNSAVHIVSKLSNCPTNGNYTNQSFKSSDGADLFNNSKDYLLICARDNTVPRFQNSSLNENGEAKTIYIETTGDAPLTNGIVECAIIDNNPFLSTDTSSKNISLSSTNSVTYSGNPNDNIKLYIQTIKDINSLSSATANLKYIESGNTITGDYSISGLENYYDYNGDMASLTYKATINSFIPVCHTSENTTQISQKSFEQREFTLQLDNWVGTLAYFWTGQFYDGFGADGEETMHGLYNKEIFDSPDFAINNKEDIKAQAQSNQCIKESPTVFFKRIDNDPPSLEVELVSQNDNKRWKYQLIEAIHDGDTPSECDLYYQVHTLDSTNQTGEEPINKKVDGAQGPETAGAKTLNGIESVGIHKIDVSKHHPIPTVKKGSRLLINVNIFDNCGFIPLSQASVSLKDTVEGNENITDKAISLDASHDMSGEFQKFTNSPRCTFYFNAPTRLSSDGNPQLTLEVKAADAEGNERIIVIPINVVDSSFKTRVLETKESRQ